MKLFPEKLAIIAFAATATVALAPLTAVAQSGNTYAVNLYNLGLAAYKQGSPESAIIFFKRACDIDPHLTDAQYNLGMIYQSEKRVKEAVPRYQAVLSDKPTDPDAHYQLGLCFIDLGQASDAKAQLLGIAPNNPHFADAQKRLSMIDAGGAVQATPQQAAAQPDVAAQNGLRPAEPAPDGSYATSSAQPAATAPQNQPPAQQPHIMQQPAQAAPYTPPAQPVQQQVQQQGQVQPQQQYQQVQPAQQVAQAPQTAVATVDGAANVPIAVLPNAEVHSFANRFNAPAGIAFDRAGNLYIANFGSNSIERITKDGIREKFSTGPNIHGPIGLVVDSGNNVFVANYSSGTIARISPSGVSTIIASGFRKPYYLAFDKEGNLFVSLQDDNSVVRISLPKAPQAAAKSM